MQTWCAWISWNQPNKLSLSQFRHGVFSLSHTLSLSLPPSCTLFHGASQCKRAAHWVDFKCNSSTGLMLKKQPFTVSFIYLIGWTLLRKPPLTFLSTVSLWYILPSLPGSGSFLFILTLTSEWKATLEITNGDKQKHNKANYVSCNIFVFEEQIVPQMQE